MSGLPMSRRGFAGVSAAGIAAGVLGLDGGAVSGAAGPADGGDWDPERPMVVTAAPLRVQPILMYATQERREAASWRSWGPINNKEAAAEEAARISTELATLAAGAGLPPQILPVATVTTVEQARKVHEAEYDVVLLYPATGSGGLLTACFAAKPERDTLIFVRHRSGPTYYWYEALSTRYLKTGAEPQAASGKGDRHLLGEAPNGTVNGAVRPSGQNVPVTFSAGNHGPVTIHDVCVDDYAEVLWRLRALAGIKNFIGQRIVALGGAGGKYDGTAPKVAREKYRLDIIEVGFDELVKRFQAARADARLVSRAEKWTEKYLAQPNTTLETTQPRVANGFLLYAVFKDLMREHRAPAVTIGNCMSGVLPFAQTTPCMVLSWLNDEGYAAFCESDFVIIPAGILLRYIAGRPVFLHNSTFPHRGIVTCAHCTAPRRMDGKRYEPARIMTHYESDAGAAPKVHMTVGQEVTFIDPEYATGRWVGFKGIIRANPMLEICRTQQDVEIQGDWKKLLAEARDSHWMMVYGDWRREIGYAAGKIGIRWVNVSESS